ncbi:MAG: NAD(P)/FAD-dependent oxidoreductase [Planctomycetota bacterium]
MDPAPPNDSASPPATPLPQQPTDPDRLNIVVIGAGFAGLTFCQKCRVKANAQRRSPEIIVIDKQNHHLFQPLLYQVATAGLASTEIAAPVRGVLSDRRDITVLMQEVTAIDPVRKQVITGDQELCYDYLILAAGGRTSYFGNDHWEAHAPGLKTLHDALRIRRRVLTAFEKAETTMDTDEQERLMTLVVVGGGPTGVELAGALGELVQRIFYRDFRRIDVRAARVILIESNDRVLKAYPDKLSASAKTQLEQLGVDVRLGVRVSDVDAEGVDLNDGTRIETRNVLWGAGVAASPLTRAFGDTAELDRGGRILVRPDLSVPGHPEVFAIGDLAKIVDADGHEVPGVAPAAMQMGKHVAKIITRELTHGAEPPEQRAAFDYWDKGSMATIGRKRAVAWVGRIMIGGFVAWFAWLAIHLMFLVTFRNKISVLIQWLYAYLTFRRGARIIIPKDHDPALTQA